MLEGLHSGLRVYFQIWKCVGTTHQLTTTPRLLTKQDNLRILKVNEVYDASFRFSIARPLTAFKDLKSMASDN
jgi:hypothetical protein